jgi:nucleotide-binding universal stress UspA family protein
MRSLESILFATDFQQASDDALNATARLATTFNSTVSVLHVMEPFSKGVIASIREEKKRSLMVPVRRRLEEQNVKIARYCIEMGSIASSILQKSLEYDVDLIVLGAGERKHPDGFSLGPIAEAVITHAEQPVLAVRPGTPRTEFKKILCPVDQSSTSARGLRNAVRLAKVFGSEIIILSVVPEVSWLSAAVETGELADVKARFANDWVQELDEFLRGFDLADVCWRKEVRYGLPNQQIVASAKEHASDLIVMGASGRTGLVQVLLGSTTRRLLRELPYSVLTVKQDDLLEDTFDNDIRNIASHLAEAWTSFSAGNYIPAIVKYRLVLTRNPFHLAALEGLVASHEKLGETEEAERYRRRLAGARRVAHPHLDSTDVGF